MRRPHSTFRPSLNFRPIILLTFAKKLLISVLLDVNHCSAPSKAPLNLLLLQHKTSFYKGINFGLVCNNIMKTSDGL